jgi:uncharacterized protein (DUF2132 family)
MKQQPSQDPLHGLTLESIVKALVYHYGWRELGRMIDIRCFNSNPSVSSSLKFLRKTPWARAKVEQHYLWMLEDKTPRAPDQTIDAGRDGAS